MTPDEVVGLILIGSGIIVPPIIIAWAAARDTIDNAPGEDHE